MDDVFPTLRALPLFKEVSDADLGALVPRAIVRAYPANAMLFAEGAPGEGLCVIAEGKVEVRKKAFDGSEHHISSLGPGETLGEMSLLDGAPRSASVRTSEPTTVLLFRREDFESFLAERPAMGVPFLLRLVRVLAARLRKTSQELADLVSVSAADDG